MKFLISCAALALLSGGLAVGQIADSVEGSAGRGAGGAVSAPALVPVSPSPASHSLGSHGQAVLIAGMSPLAVSQCSFTFTSGVGPTFLKYCVTTNGNVTQLEAPQGHEHIAVGDASEGYGICDFNTNVAYFDYADSGDSGNWGAAKVVQQNSNSVKIARTTSDGVWTLTQAIALVTGTPSMAQITMTIKNNTNVQRSMRLFRFADVDADGVFNNNLDGTFQSSFGWNSIDAGHSFGMAMVNVGGTIFSNGGFAQNTPSGPDPCNPFVHSTFKTLTAVDGSLAHFYTIDVGKGGSTTVKIGYKGL